MAFKLKVLKGGKSDSPQKPRQAPAKPTRVCVACGKKYRAVLVHFERRRNGKLDTVCVDCRDKERRRKEELRRIGKAPSLDHSRNTRNGFMDYMRENPVYFQSIFGMVPCEYNFYLAWLNTNAACGIVRGSSWKSAQSGMRSMNNIHVKSLIGPFCITRESGQAVFEAISPIMQSGNSVVLDFAGISHFTAIFFNAAVGLLYRDFPDDEIRRLLRFSNLSVTGRLVANRVLLNSSKYWRDDGYRHAVDSVLSKLAASS